MGILLKTEHLKRYRDIAGDGGSDIVGQVSAQQDRLRARLAGGGQLEAVLGR